MNPSKPIDEVRARLQKIAAEFTIPPRSRSKALLEPFAESIRELRERGASFSAITQILKGENIEVSRFAVGRFCRDHLGVIRKVRQRRGPYKRKAQADDPAPSNQRKLTAKPTPSWPSSPYGTLEDGPHIVDLDNL